MYKQRTAVGLILLLLLLNVGAAAQTAPPPTSSQPQAPDVRMLKPELQAKGRELLENKEPSARARLAVELMRADASGALEFVLAVLLTDPSPTVRLAIINRLGSRSNPKVRQALEWIIPSDPDVRVARLALERLRVMTNIEVRELLMRRLETARSRGDQEEIKQLAIEQERWISLVRGTMLPSFMRVPPPIFHLKSEEKPIRVLAFGDFGTGSAAQKQVAAATLEYHRRSPFDFAVTLGDNFYSIGMESPTDPRWKTWWDDLYNPLGIKFYATLGNHDWGHADSPASEILYSRESSSWQMPSTYYTYVAGPVQFFALDTNEMSEAQLMWLKSELSKSRARWKIVYGHHPIYSAGQHANNTGLIARLLPVLKGQVDIYLAGHDHDLQHLKPEGDLHFFVSGGGGAGIRPINANERSLFAKSSYGFLVLDADLDTLRVTFIGADSSKLYEYTIKF